MSRSRMRLAALMAVLQEAVPVDSLEQQVDAVRSAVWRRNDLTPEGAQWQVLDVFEGFTVVRSGNQLFKVPYTFGEEGAVQFGEPEKVAVEFRAIQESSATANAQLVEAAGVDAGFEWDVTIIRAGHSRNGFYYPRTTLQHAVDRKIFEGIDVYAFGDEPAGHKKNPLLKAPHYLAGWIDNVRMHESADSVIGRLHFLESLAADGDRMRRQLVDAWGRGKRDLFGLSIDARGPARPPAVIEGRTAQLVESIAIALSVDIVLKPAAGGAFTRLVASAADDSSQGGSMLKKRLLKLLEARRPDVYAGVDATTITIDRLEELLGDDIIQESIVLQPATAAAATAPAAAAATGSPAAAAVDAVQEVRKAETRWAVRTKLQESRLPELVQKRLFKQLDGQVLSETQIQEAIDAERQYLADINPARVTVPGGGGRVEVGAEKLDRLQAAFDRACGLVPEKAEFKTIKPIGLRALYNEITLGRDPEVTGQLQESDQQAMLQEAFTNATLPRVVANTLYRRMLKDYRELDYGERRIISVRPGVSDFKTQEAVRIGYFGDLSTVDPEAADYAEIAAYGEEAATYSVGQKGNLVTITRKHIKNDDIGHVGKVVGRLGRSARRTFAKFVWNFFILNGNIYDATAWFTVGHGNLLTTALSPTTLTSARNALFNQLELSSAQKLGLNLKYLVVPIDLEDLAIKINSGELHATAVADVNRWKGKFGANHENIIVNPFMTDANDWGVFADPQDGDIIEVAFMDGNEEPELFVADVPTIGQMFTADKLVFKIRHEYGGAVVDFRTAVKSVVP